MTTALKHILWLILALAATRFIALSPVFGQYHLQLTALILLIFIATSLWHRKIQSNTIKVLYVNVYLLVCLILVLVFTTGGLQSPLFFMFYLLLFLTSLILSPAAGLILSIGLGLIFLPEINSTNSLLQAGSLILISPMSFWLGKYYLQVLKNKGEIAILKQKTAKQAKDLAAEESDSLLWLSLNFENSMLQIIETLQDFIITTPPQTRWHNKITKAYQHGLNLLQSGHLLKKRIDKQTD